MGGLRRTDFNFRGDRAISNRRGIVSAKIEICTSEPDLIQTLEISTQAFFVAARGGAAGAGLDGFAQVRRKLGEPSLFLDLAHVARPRPRGCPLRGCRLWPRSAASRPKAVPSGSRSFRRSGRRRRRWAWGWSGRASAVPPAPAAGPAPGPGFRPGPGPSPAGLRRASGWRAGLGPELGRASRPPVPSLPGRRSGRP